VKDVIRCAVSVTLHTQTQAQDSRLNKNLFLLLFILSTKIMKYSKKKYTGPDAA